MLAEFFLTPDTFCESDDSLRQLQACLFPWGPNASVGVICHFGEDEWEQVVSNRIFHQIHDHHRRDLAMNLFKRIADEIAVFRPPINKDVKSEEEWVDVAKQSKKILELDGLVVSQAIDPCPDDSVRLSEFAKSGFWTEFGNPRIVGRDKPSQVPILNTICAHSDWLIVRMPQVKGGGDDEIVTIKQIIQLANGLPDGYRKNDVIIEVPITKKLEDARGTEGAAKSLMHNIKGELAAFKSNDQEISIAVYPVGSFNNREIIAGEFAFDSDKNALFKPRWYMTMNHVAVKGDKAGKRIEGNSWNLYSKKMAKERFDALADAETVIPVEVV